MPGRCFNHRNELPCNVTLLCPVKTSPNCGRDGVFVTSASCVGIRIYFNAVEKNVGQLGLSELSV